LKELDLKDKVNEMNQKTLKIFSIVISALLLLIFFASIAGFVGIETFWVAAILVALFAFLVLPKLNKK